MAVKTFSVGETLTASDTNTYLANGGLVLITSGITVSSAGGTAATVSNGTVTVGSGNTSVTVSGAFSSTYDNYRIMWTGGGQSVATAMQMQLGAINTGYYGVLIYSTVISASVLKDGDNNSAQWTYVGGGNSDYAVVNCDVLNAYSGRKGIQANVSYGITTSGANGWYQGWANFTDTCTSFKLFPASGTMSNGTIKVYGYRKA